MKTFFITLIAVLCASSVAAQTAIPKKPESSMKVPADPGMKMPSDKGSVVTPPTTGNEEIAKTPPKNVDPKIDDATPDVDRKNRKKSEDKQKAQ